MMMTSRFKIAVDICNTLADVNNMLEKLLGPRPDLSLYEYPGATPDFFLRHPEVFAEAKPIPGALEGIRFLSQNAEIVYLTARPAWARELTAEWLLANGFPPGRLIHSEAKALVAKEIGVHLAADDSPAEIEQYRRQNITVLAKKQPYNQKFRPRYDWPELAQAAVQSLRNNPNPTKKEAFSRAFLLRPAKKV